jgi:hypothetical protein
MNPHDWPRYRAFMGLACGVAFWNFMTHTAHGGSPGLILFFLFLTIINGYFAFRPLRGAEDDSGKGCQSERCQCPAGRN